MIKIQVLNEKSGYTRIKLVCDTGITEMSLVEAINKADEEELDLVIMSDGKVPVCKILDYNKLLYSRKKNNKERAKSKVVDKEIRIGPNIALHDMKVKANAIDKLLNDGCNVKIVITYFGRMNVHIKGGISKLNDLVKMLNVKYNIKCVPTILGNKVYMVITP